MKGILLFLVLYLVYKLSGIDIELFRKVFKLSVKLGVTCDERLVKHLYIQKVLKRFYRESGVLRRLHLHRNKLAVSHLKAAS